MEKPIKQVKKNTNGAQDHTNSHIKRVVFFEYIFLDPPPNQL